MIAGMPRARRSTRNLWYRRNMGRYHPAAPPDSSSSIARILLFAFALALLVAVAPGPRSLQAQEIAAPPSEEIVANLAAGRVIVAVVKDAIIVATVENPIEPQTHPPIPVQLNSRRVGVLLGAVDWFSPSSEVQLARLDQELPNLRAQIAAQAPGVNPRL